MKLAVRHPDVVVWASLKGRPAKFIPAASQERLPTVVVNGEVFRSLDQAHEAEMCLHVAK
jgi:hypothetical protein